MHLHAIDDEIIPYADPWDWKEWDAVGPMHDVPSLVQFCADQNSCQDEAETESGSPAHTVHDGCDGDVRVEHHRLGEGGDAWPDQVAGVSTHQVIWSFVSEFSKPWWSSTVVLRKDSPNSLRRTSRRSPLPPGPPSRSAASRRP